MPRSTRVIPVDRENPSADVLAEAGDILRGGGLVAFATETVYGLGADATNPEAVVQIFEAKGRPPTNPLIVHADAMEMARSCVAGWNEAADALAHRFWPGPLTIIRPRSALIPDAVTAGRDTVGVRIPDATVARRLIAATGRPIAAPSANRSNRVSPVTAGHVAEDLDGRIDLILDSGGTTVGLESTIVDTSAPIVRILRPGPIGVREVRQALGGREVREGPGPAESGPAISPGQSPLHYAPTTPAIRVDGEKLSGLTLPGPSGLLYFGRYIPPTSPKFAWSFALGGPKGAAEVLYLMLRELDALGLSLIVVVPPPDRPEWRAIRDRLWRATRPVPDV